MQPAGNPPDKTLARFKDPRHEWRRVVAEAWGTFLLVLVAAGVDIMAARTPRVSPGIAAIAPGMIVVAIIYFMGSVSGAHLNPAVTLAFAVRRNFPWRRVPGYLAAQFVGALAAALFLRLTLGTAGSLGATQPGAGVSPALALLLEVVLTAGLVNTILGTASGARNVGSNGAIAVGAYVAVSKMWAGPLTGASMNPIRSLAPDLVRVDLGTTWVYVVGPLVGAMLGVLLEWALKGRPTLAGSRAAQGDLEDVHA